MQLLINNRRVNLVFPHLIGRKTFALNVSEFNH
ncbi:hypothetical protein gpAD87_29575 [Paenibacillus sp. AD87]|nr:hypothetical protein gpAD87_29575 [Paenibacillus sp. AD87]